MVKVSDRSKFGLFLLCSLLGHTVVLLLLFKQHFNLAFSPPEYVEISSFPVEHKFSPIGRGGSGGSFARRKRTSDLGISDLLPRWEGNDVQNSATTRSGGKTTGVYDPWGKAGAMGVMNSMSLEEYAPQLSFFESLWQKIDSAIEYPSDFSKQRISGHVSVHLTVDKRGVFTGKFLKVQATDKLLEAYVLVALIHSLSTPLREAVWLNSREELPLALHLDFRLEVKGERSDPPTNTSMKNNLIFCKTALVEPIVFEKVDQFFTRYFPPVIPLPGGFYVDFVRAYQFVANLGLQTEEEIRANRLGFLRTKLETAIRKSDKLNENN